MLNKKMTNQDQKKDNQSPLNNYSRYSSIAFQMGIIIALGVFGGVKLDKKFNMQNPVFTITLSLLGVFAAMYVVIKDISKMNK